MKHLTKTLTVIAGVAVSSFSSLAQISKSPPELPAPPPAPMINMGGAFGFGGGSAGSQFGSDTGRTLVIPQKAPDARSLSNMEEDMQVMARILEKAAGHDGSSRKAMGIAIQGAVFGAPMTPKNLYIEGHGALFFLEVNYPLVPPADAAAESETKADTSSEWEEARRELHQTQSAWLDLNLPFVPGLGGASESYDPDAVKELKKDLTAALKNAAYIRQLGPDESATVIVAGRQPNANTKTVTHRSNVGRSATVTVASRPSTAGRGTTLILRAAKSDIEAFEKGKLGLDEFRNKVTEIVY